MPTIPPAKVPKILDRLNELIQQGLAQDVVRRTPAFAGPRSRFPTSMGLRLWCFELPNEVDILLNHDSVGSDKAWDNPAYQHVRWSSLPKRVEKRMIESDDNPYRQWRQALETENTRRNIQVEVLSRASRPCPPDSAAIWSDKEFIGAVDRHGAYTKPYEWTGRYYSAEEFIVRLNEILTIMQGLTPVAENFNPKG